MEVHVKESPRAAPPRTVPSPPTAPPRAPIPAGSVSPGKTPAQTWLRRTLVLGAIAGLAQVGLAIAALGTALWLLKHGTLITPSAILLPVASVACYVVALIPVTGLRKHQRFASWIPILCYLFGVALCARLAFLHLGEALGPNGLQVLLVQPGASLPPGSVVMGEPAPVVLLAFLTALAGALGALPLFCIARLHLNPESRRLLKWMATQ